MDTFTVGHYTFNVNEEGEFIEPISPWNEEIAGEIAKQEGIDALNDDHWTVIRFMREIAKQEGYTPSIIAINKQAKISTKRLYELFDRKLVRCAAKIAGLPKPSSCI